MNVHKHDVEGLIGKLVERFIAVRSQRDVDFILVEEGVGDAPVDGIVINDERPAARQACS